MARNIINRHQRGFTFIELVIVIAMIGILATITIVAIRPSKQLGDSRNTQRSSDVGTIVNAAYQYATDNNGALPPTITTTATEICATTASGCTGLIDLSTLTASSKYLVAVPQDPLCKTVCAANGTGYKVLLTAAGRVTVSAPGAENGKTISTTK